MTHSNCLIFALWMLRRRGGYLVFRRSDFWGFGCGFHVLWAERASAGHIRMLSVVPHKPKVKRILPRLWFKSVLILNDNE